MFFFFKQKTAYKIPLFSWARRCVSETGPDLRVLLDALLRHGPEGLAGAVQLCCGVPVRPMLARACTGVADAIVQLASTAGGGAGAAAAGRRRGMTSSRREAGTVAAAAAAALPAPAAVAAASEPAASAAAGSCKRQPAVDQSSSILCGSSDGSSNNSGDSSCDDGGSSSQGISAPDSAGNGGGSTDVVVHRMQEQPGAPSLLGTNSITAGQTEQPADAAAAHPPAPAAAAGSAMACDPSLATMAVLAEFKYDGQRAQIHATLDQQVQTDLVAHVVYVAAGLSVCCPFYTSYVSDNMKG